MGAGWVFIFAAMIGAVLLVVDVLVSRAWVLTMVGSLAAVFIALWLIVPVHDGYASRTARRTNQADASLEWPGQSSEALASLRVVSPTDLRTYQAHPGARPTQA